MESFHSYIRVADSSDFFIKENTSLIMRVVDKKTGEDKQIQLDRENGDLVKIQISNLNGEAIELHAFLSCCIVTWSNSYIPILPFDTLKLVRAVQFVQDFLSRKF